MGFKTKIGVVDSIPDSLDPDSILSIGVLVEVLANHAKGTCSITRLVTADHYSVPGFISARMVAERKQIAEKFRSEGKGEARKIEGDKEREMKRITSEAYKRAQEIKGKADAEATKIYAQAYGQGPDFYSFIQTLEIYKDALGADSSLVLSTESEFFKYLKGQNKAKK